MNTNEQHIKSHFPALYKAPSAPSEPTWTLIFSLEVDCQPKQWITLSHSWDTLASSIISVLSAKTEDSPLPGRWLCSPSLQGLRKVPAGCFLAAKKETASCSHWETANAKDLVFKKTTNTETSAAFSFQATQCQLSPCSRSCLSCNGNTSLHSTAMAAQAPATEEGLSGLNPAHALLVGHKEISYISLLKIS